jgi:hypothetical protein
MLRNDAFAQADALELANFMQNCGYEDLLKQDVRNIQPDSYVTFWRKDDVQVCNDLEEVRKLAQAIYEGSHVKCEKKTSQCDFCDSLDTTAFINRASGQKQRLCGNCYSNGLLGFDRAIEDKEDARAFNVLW